jgi:hypothetical protein
MARDLGILRRLAIGVLLVIAGTVFGPVVIAALNASFASDDPFEQSDEVSRLMDAYQARIPPHLLFLTLVSPPDDGQECGYDPKAVFGDDRHDDMMRGMRDGHWTDYEGYDALDRWRQNLRGERALWTIEGMLNDELSAFEAAFLRQCIESTLFSSMCMAKVHAIGESVEHRPKAMPRFASGSGNEHRVVCGYVDGIAARRGIRLAERKD